jgi:hypothetical protein
VVPPLAPLWGWQEHMRKRAVLWLGCAALYVVALVLSLV